MRINLLAYFRRDDWDNNFLQLEIMNARNILKKIFKLYKIKKLKNILQLVFPNT